MPVIFSHGFPELAYSWRHQIPAVAAAGYRVIAPDQRGYGADVGPRAIDQYDILHLSDDLIALLDELGEEKAVFVGHDWGSMVVWQTALLHPDRVAGVRGMSVPFVPARAEAADALLRAVFGDVVLLHPLLPGARRRRRRTRRRSRQDDAAAARRPAHRPEAGAGSVLRRRRPRLRRPHARSPRRCPAGCSQPSWTTTCGVQPHGLHRWHELVPQLRPQLGAHPAARGRARRGAQLFIGGALDPVLVMSPPGEQGRVAHRPSWHRDHRGRGHWVQQEEPDQVNRALLGFLDSISR